MKGREEKSEREKGMGRGKGKGVVKEKGMREGREERYGK